MLYREIGTPGIEASVVALGTWAIGGWMWGGTDEADAIKAINAAIDNGINLIDTAPMYGFGLSEEIVGKAIRGKRDKVVLASKCGMIWDREQGIKEGKYALNWTRLSCHDFVDNQVRLQLFALAYNLGNFLRRLALPKRVKQWSLRTLRVKLIKIGAKVVKHARYVTFQMAEVLLSKGLFQEILERIHRLKPAGIGYD